MNRAQRRAKKKKGVPGYHAMTKEQKIEKLFQNGITDKDLEKAYKDGRLQALRDTTSNVMKTCYAAICMAVNEQLGFGPKRMIRLLCAVDEHVCNSFTGIEAVQEVFDKHGILIDFKDPEGHVQEGAIC